MVISFDYDHVNEYVPTGSSQGRVGFFKLAGDQSSAKVRFMYGPGETFKGYLVHSIGKFPEKVHSYPCLRGPGQPLESCPLCKAGLPTMAQYYIPLYVISTSKFVNGVYQPEEPVNEVMIWQRGKMIQSALASAIRQSASTPLVSNVFNIVRSGVGGSRDTVYTVEFVSRDNTTLQQLPERPKVLGTPILPDMTFEDLTMIANGNNSGNNYSNTPSNMQNIQPRTNTTQNGYPPAISRADNVPF